MIPQKGRLHDVCFFKCGVRKRKDGSDTNFKEEITQPVLPFLVTKKLSKNFFYGGALN